MRARDAASRLVTMRTKNCASALLIKAGIEPALITKTIQFNIEKGLGLFRAIRARRLEGLCNVIAEANGY